MPKLITYRRPAPVSKQNWNHAPDHKAQLPVRSPTNDKPAPHPAALPPLRQLLGKS
jgi:hypothetical protein